MQGIYIIHNLVNNYVYVGQTSNFNHRVNSHRCDLRKGRGLQKLQVDWNKFGEDAFEFIFLCECDDKNERNRLEKYYITKYNSIELGYNTTSGGIGQGNFGRHNGMHGKKHTKESRELMSKNRKGITSGSNNPNYGNHDNSKYTKEVRLKMSQKQRERWARIKQEKSQRDGTEIP